MTGRKIGVRRSRRRGDVTMSGDETNTADSNIDSGRENEGFESGYSQAANAAGYPITDNDVTDSEVEKITGTAKSTSGHKNDTTQTTNTDRPKMTKSRQMISIDTTEQEMRDRQIQVRQQFRSSQAKSLEDQVSGRMAEMDENGNPYQEQIDRDEQLAIDLALEERERMERERKEKMEDEHYKLPFTNKEIFEQREEITKLLEIAPQPANRAVSRQLNKAIEEYRNLPSEAFRPESPKIPLIPGKSPVNQKTRRAAQFEMNRTGKTTVTANEVRARVQATEDEQDEIRAARRKINSQQKNDASTGNGRNERNSTTRDRRVARAMSSPEIRQPAIIRDKSLENNPLYNTYNPMRIRSPVRRWKGCTRRQARRAEYDRVFGKPLYNDYPSSDTDLSEEYTTEQEDFETVENRFANAEGDWRLWPWPKMRKAQKELRRGVHNPRMTEAERARREIDPKRTIRDPSMQPGREAKIRAAPEVIERIRRLEDELTRQRQKIQQKEIQEEQLKNEVTVLTNKQKRKERMQQEKEVAIEDYEDDEISADRTKTRTAMNPRSKLTVRTSQLPDDNHNNNCSCGLNFGRPQEMVEKTISCRSDRNHEERNIEPRPVLREIQNLPTMEKMPQVQIPANEPRRVMTSESNYSMTAPYVDNLRLDIPTFEGENWPTFLNQFENVAEYLQWSPRLKAVHLHNQIRGDAGKALSAAETRQWTYEQLVEHMELRHGKVKSYGDIVIEIMGQTRKPGQALSSWHDQVISITNTASLSESQKQSARFYGFIYGLRGNSSLYNKVLSQIKEQTIGEAFKKAVAYEKDHGSHISYMYPGNVNMMSIKPTEEEKKNARENPDRALLNAIKDSSMTESGPLSAFLTQMSGQIERLGEKFEQRFDRLDIRVGTLERQSKEQTSRNYNSRGRGGYGDYNNNYGDRNNSYGRNNDNRQYYSQGRNDSRGGGFNRGRGRGNFNGQSNNYRDNGNNRSQNGNDGNGNSHDNRGSSPAPKMTTRPGIKQE